MKKIILLFLFFAISPFPATGSSLNFEVSCKLDKRLGVGGTSDYKNTWILNIDSKNNNYSVLDTYASARFSNKDGSLKFLGVFDGYYYMILRSGYLYIYSNKQKGGFYDEDTNLLRVVDPRGDIIVYIANCKSIR